MKRYYGNEKAAPGVYFNLREISFKSLEEEGCLPGTATDEYYRVPILALLVVGPVLGGVYAMFLPLIGFAMVAWVGAGKVAQLAGVPDLAPVLRPAWRPGMAFFSRRKPVAHKAKRRDEWAERVEKELEAEDHDDAA